VYSDVYSKGGLGREMLRKQVVTRLAYVLHRKVELDSRSSTENLMIMKSPLY
jgi:hypothetical protein